MERKTYLGPWGKKNINQEKRNINEHCKMLISMSYCGV